MDIFDDINSMVEKLVWIPTWHQARSLSSELGMSDDAVARLWRSHDSLPAGDDLIRVYEIIIKFLKRRPNAAPVGNESDLERLSLAVLTSRLGDISDLPENLTGAILDVHQQSTAAYLNILRQKENKPRDWFPKSRSIDPELTDGMRYFFSGYQHITKKNFYLNQKIDQLQRIDKGNQAKLYQEITEGSIDMRGKYEETIEYIGKAAPVSIPG